MKLFIVMSVLALSALNGHAFLSGKKVGKASSAHGSAAVAESSAHAEASSGGSAGGLGGFDIGSLLA